MNLESISSLDRLLWRHADELLDSSLFVRRQPYRIVRQVSQVVFCLLGIIFSLYFGNDNKVWLAIGFSGLLYFSWLSLVVELKSQLKVPFTYTSAKPTTMEGQQLIHRICTHIGYANYQQQGPGRHLALTRGLNTSSQILDKKLFSLLESAAFQFNQVEAMLLERKGANDRQILGLAPSIRAASFESMASVFSHAAAIDRYPENADDHVLTITARTNDLAELATRISALAKTSPNIVEESYSRTIMGDVLGRLRDEELSAKELEAIPNASHHPQEEIEGS